MLEHYLEMTILYYWIYKSESKISLILIKYFNSNYWALNFIQKTVIQGLI